MPRLLPILSSSSGFYSRPVLRLLRHRRPGLCSHRSQSLATLANPPLQSMAPAFTLFTHPSTPNGLKMSLFLEELKAAYPKTAPEYKTYQLAMWRLEHREPWYLKINPNGKVPALVHHRPGGKNHSVFESTAMIVYLAQHFDPDHKLSFPRLSDEESECMQWTLWGHGELGPIQGLTGQHLSHPTLDMIYSIKRFLGKTQRMYTMLDNRLEGRDWLVGPGRGRISIADISVYPWIAGHSWAGIESLKAFPNINRWKKAMTARPAIRRASSMPGGEMSDDEDSSELDA